MTCATGLALPPQRLSRELRDEWGRPSPASAVAAASSAGPTIFVASSCIRLHSVSAVYPVFPFNIEQFDTALARHTVSHTFAMMANLVSMVTTGVPVDPFRCPPTSGGIPPPPQGGSTIVGGTHNSAIGYITIDVAATCAAKNASPPTRPRPSQPRKQPPVRLKLEL